ncbi:hypothetical protein Bhyg_13013 [Pseudolycoriella hygida]|uniref:Uncharacterized protein n=1 Tax=Pseudolycoriella hygida TaxID=35572 RepID=A0A9Q0S1U7_9DIPT|nr:hypothetical protein Bhyg_13013 [Pseudolycoriella hygida]
MLPIREDQHEPGGEVFLKSQIPTFKSCQATVEMHVDSMDLDNRFPMNTTTL